jgi:hypothetical protein
MFVRSTNLTRIWAEYGRELASGNRNVAAFIARTAGEEAVMYTAALNAKILLRESGITDRDIRRLSFRKTGPGERDLVCDIKLEPESSYPAEIVSIDVSKLPADKYPMIEFPYYAFNT